MLFSWASLGILAGVVAAVTVGLHLTQRWVPHHRREKHNDVAGFIFAAIAVFYVLESSVLTRSEPQPI